MKRLVDPLLAEFNHEAHTTRRLLERLPDDKLGWKPHEKSMTLGKLATHLAEIPAFFTSILVDETTPAGGGAPRPAATTRDEILAAFEGAIARFTATLGERTDAQMLERWRFVRGEQVIVELPRVAAVRALVLSHSIHHRGQLSVYLRLLDIPVPRIYGPSADEPM
jgi:uncharacterized damage-inducible protein DinB